MLSSLYISNYALIDHIEIAFGENLNIITGETGSGKSIVMGALSLLLGERAETRTIRDNTRKTIVEAKFDISGNKDIYELLEQYELDVDSSACILRREISIKGSSRAFVNDTPVNLTVLKSVSERLLDIHTQNENLLLADKDFQLQVIDSMADNLALRNEYVEAYTNYRKILKDYTAFKAKLEQEKNQAELNDFLLEQLERLDLKAGEQEELEKEREIQTNLSKIKLSLDESLNCLSGNERNAVGLVDKAIGELRKLKEYGILGDEILSRIESVRAELADISECLDEKDSSISGSEMDLEQIEGRLEAIYNLEARHHVDSDRELIEIRETLRNKKSDVENGDNILADLEKRARLAKKNVVLSARRLTESRIKAAAEFSESITRKAKPLGMPNLQCSIAVEATKLKESGMDNIDFLFAFNKNQPLMPVGKTASGGEIARVILAIKSILVDKMQLPTVIFDEIDTGVSGEIANQMAKLMLDLAKSTQVITITHIATVAAHGSRHYKIFKKDENNSTQTHIRLLSDDERVKELALMISGDPNDGAALNTASSLLDKNR